MVSFPNTIHSCCDYFFVIGNDEHLLSCCDKYTINTALFVLLQLDFASVGMFIITIYVALVSNEHVIVNCFCNKFKSKF